MAKKRALIKEWVARFFYVDFNIKIYYYDCSKINIWFEKKRGTMVQTILDIMQRIFMIRRYKSKEEELRAALLAFTTWHELETITQEEYEELQKILEEYANQWYNICVGWLFFCQKRDGALLVWGLPMLGGSMLSKCKKINVCITSVKKQGV